MTYYPIETPFGREILNYFDKLELAKFQKLIKKRSLYVTEAYISRMYDNNANRGGFYLGIHIPNEFEAYVKNQEINHINKILLSSKHFNPKYFNKRKQDINYHVAFWSRSVDLCHLIIMSDLAKSDLELPDKLSKVVSEIYNKAFDDEDWYIIPETDSIFETSTGIIYNIIEDDPKWDMIGDIEELEEDWGYWSNEIRR